jgi:pimeloyl-ACP methyl ester carboxylesterase
MTRWLTERALLAMRTGWPAYQGNLLDSFGYDRAEILRRLRYFKPRYSLREVAQYSNPGIFVASEVAGRAANQSWNDLVEKNCSHHWLLDHWCGTKDVLAGEAVAEYHRCFDAAAIRATCEEFRAAATIDLVHDDADRERKISCPTLLLWSATSLWATYDMLEVWRSRAEDVQGVALDGGHFLPEENPERTAAELLRFLL